MDDDELEKMGFMKFPVGGGYMGDEDDMLIDLNRLKAGVEARFPLNGSPLQQFHIFINSSALVIAILQMIQ